MKKLLALILAALMLLTLVACSDEDEMEEELKDYLVNDKVVDNVTNEDGETFYFDLIDSETVIITGYNSGDKAHPLNIPETLDGKAVVAIADEAFYGCSKINSITLPTTVTSIGAYAFARCEMVTAIAIPNTVTTIGEGAFYGCKAATTLTIGTGISGIEKYTFWGLTSLTSVTVPANVKTVAQGAFYGCTALESVTVEEGVELIGAQAFQNCTVLATLKLSASIVSIGDHAFDGGSLYVEGIELPTDTSCAAYKYVTEVLKPENKPVEQTPAQ